MFQEVLASIFKNNGFLIGAIKKKKNLTPDANFANSKG